GRDQGDARHRSRPRQRLPAAVHHRAGGIGILLVVMAGLVPAISLIRAQPCPCKRDARVKPAHDESVYHCLLVSLCPVVSRGGRVSVGRALSLRSNTVSRGRSEGLKLLISHKPPSAMTPAIRIDGSV